MTEDRSVNTAMKVLRWLARDVRFLVRRLAWLVYTLVRDVILFSLTWMLGFLACFAVLGIRRHDRPGRAGHLHGAWR
jgi:hypothetical protein